MSDIDAKHADAVALAEEMGFRWTGTSWEYPHVDELPEARRLSLIDIGDLLYEALAAVGGVLPPRIAGVTELWETHTSYISRHTGRSTTPKYKFVPGPRK